MKSNPIRRIFLLLLLFIAAVIRIKNNPNEFASRYITLPANALDDGVENLRQTGEAFASVGRTVSPSVVFIQIESEAAGSSATRFSSPFGEEWPFGDDFFKRFFGDQFPGIPKAPQPETPRGERRTMGQGSGFVFAAKNGLLSDKTFILTNNHVVENADKIRVQFQDGREFDAKITGRDPQSDIAVIEIEAGGLPALPLADSSSLEVGEWVVAIGNPFGLSHTLTVGAVKEGSDEKRVLLLVRKDDAQRYIVLRW